MQLYSLNMKIVLFLKLQLNLKKKIRKLKASGLQVTQIKYEKVIAVM